MRILIVDDHEVVREGLQATLASTPGFEVVDTAATAADALRLAVRLHPEVAVIDLRLPDMTGQDLCKRLKASAPSTKVIVLTTYLSEGAVRSSLDAGADAYVTKAAGIAALKEAIHDVTTASQEVSDRSKSTAQIVNRLHDAVRQREGALRVTPQQERVLQLASEGLTNREVGERLFISESTVRFHLQRLRELTGARTRTELIAKAMRAGVIPIGEDL